MKKDVVKKIEEEIKQKTTLPENIKEKIRKEILKNILIAIIIVVYFTFLILGSVGTIKNVRSIDFNIFSMLILGIAIYLFEVSYKKDNGKLALLGIESLITAIFTLFLPYIIFELDAINKKYYLIISGYVAVYYIIKCICISVRTRNKYMKQTSDISEIIKKNKIETKRTVNTKDANKEMQSEIKGNNTQKTTKNKTNDTKVNLDDTNNAPKKRGRPKKSDTTNNEKKNSVKVARHDAPQPKKRGRPKKSETTNNENKNNVEVKQQDTPQPKKRGRPRKVVISND